MDNRPIMLEHRVLKTTFRLRRKSIMRIGAIASSGA
jgi:hypothetical protein